MDWMSFLWGTLFGIGLSVFVDVVAGVMSTKENKEWEDRMDKYMEDR